MDGAPIIRRHLSSSSVCVCVCRRIRGDSVVHSGISMLSIWAHLSLKSHTSGISDAARVSGSNTTSDFPICDSALHRRCVLIFIKSVMLTDVRDGLQKRNR